MREHALATLMVATGVGLAVGIAADFAVGGVPSSFGDVALAVVFSPLLAAIGGRAVDSSFSTLFFIGGLLFWPVWAFLAWRWFRNRQLPVAVMIAVWSAQGFFQLLHRFAMVMSA